MPKSYLREEEKAGLDQNAIYAAESAAAARAGDRQAEWEWLAKADLPAHCLMAAKRLHGADWIREKGLKTEPAEKVYGKDWLEK